MWQVLGICILIWLGVGLIVGFKTIYIDKFLDEIYEKIDSGEVKVDEDLLDILNRVRGNKPFFLVIFMILGVFGFYADTKRTFRKQEKK